MEFTNIAIIGVGLIGGSFALSLKRHGFSGIITGIGRREENLIRAKGLGIIDRYTTASSEGIEDADLILLSTPVGQFEGIIKAIREKIRSGAIVTDVGSVKAEVVRRLEPLMPEGVSFIGTHPIAGRECSGPDAATASLFENTKCIITPTSSTDREALNRIRNLWNMLGSETLLMSPEEHDVIFAAVSHLPHVVAYALINTITDMKKDIIIYGGSGLRDMTRIASSPAVLWRDICAYNKENILRALERFSSSISHMRELIEKADWAGLEREFIKAREGREILESD
jgi:prephenate dehydrogenase